MKFFVVLFGVMFAGQLAQACPTCVGEVKDSCPPFFSAACYVAQPVNDGAENKSVAYEDRLILQGEQSNEEKKQ